MKDATTLIVLALCLAAAIIGPLIILSMHAGH